MKSIYHSAESRGQADHGWLKARHSFSFANYFDPERVQFGKLRVLNDDIVAPAKGFGTHPHDNMEIITIPLSGSLEHKDSMGNGSVIRSGEVQVMSAGSGVYHSEFNPSDSEETNLLQIWIFPEEQNVTPRYDQKAFDDAAKINSILQVVGNNKESDALFIHQKAAISLSRPSAGTEINYTLNYTGSGVYVFLINGKVEVGDQTLSKRDAAGIWEIDSLTVKATEDSYILFLEVPMQ